MTSKAGRFCHKKYQHFAKGTEKSFKHDFIFYYIKYTKRNRKNTGVPNTFKGLLLFSLIVFHLIVQISGCRFCLLFILCLVFRFYSYNCSFVCYLLFYFDRLFYVFYSVFLPSRSPSCLHLLFTFCKCLHVYLYPQLLPARHHVTQFSVCTVLGPHCSHAVRTRIQVLTFCCSFILMCNKPNSLTTY